MTEKELLHVLQNVDEKYSAEAQQIAAAAQKPLRRRIGFSMIAAGAAACIGLTVFALMPRFGDSMPAADNDISNEIAEVQAPETEKEEPAVTAAAPESVKPAASGSTKKQQKKDTAAEKPAETAAVPDDASAPAAEAAKPDAADPVQTTAEPAKQEEPSVSAEMQLPVIGDFDLDGKFTLADGVWCDLIYFAEMNDVMDMIPLTEAQIRQADMIPGCIRDDNPAYPLGIDEEQAILATLRLIYCYNLTDITPQDYIADQNYYDDYTLIRSPRLVRELPIDWAAIGLTGDFTEDDFWRAVSPDYALERYEEENGPFRRDNDDISDFLNAVRVRQDKYHGMISELMIRERDKWKDPIYDYGIAAERCMCYAAKLHQQKFGEPGYKPGSDEPVDPRLIFTDDDLTWDEMLKVFEEAKTYTDFAAPDFRL